MRQNPEQPVGPTFGLVDEGHDAFEDFVEELNTDSDIGSRVSRKAIETGIGALLREFKSKTDVTDERLNTAIRQVLQSLRSLI